MDDRWRPYTAAPPCRQLRTKPYKNKKPPPGRVGLIKLTADTLDTILWLLEIHSQPPPTPQQQVVVQLQAYMSISCGHYRELGPASKQHWINVTCLLACRPYTGMSSDVTDQDSVCVIGRGRLSRPIMCRRSSSAALRMFFTTIVAMASEAFKPRVTFSKTIYINEKYCINIMIDLVS